MVEVNHDEIKKFKNRMKEISDSILFWALFTIWFLVIAIHFYYLSFTLSNNGVLNINKLMNTFKVKMIIDYLWVVILPFSFKIVYYFSIRKPLLDKPFSKNEKKEVKLAFKGLGFVFLVAVIFSIIFL